MQSWRLVIDGHGGPEVIRQERFDPGLPGPGEVLVAHEAVGLNFIDTYMRSGLYPGALPSGLGVEAAGKAVAIGADVTSLSVGDYVAYAVATPGSYATHRILPTDRLLTLPSAIGSDLAAAAMLKGLTATFLIADCAKVMPGQTVLVHAAAGGVGSILLPWLTNMGAVVIAHSGSSEKASKAAALGAQHSLSCPLDDLAATVRDLTDGQGVDVVLDGVGKDSWAASLSTLKPRGLMVSYGNASGAVPPISVLELSRGGSLFLTRPTLFDYIRDPADLQRLGKMLFDRIASGVINVEIGQRYPLEQAAAAHHALEARQTTGSTILTL